MSTATIEELQSQLVEMLDRVAAGEPIIITRDGKPVACLTTELPNGIPIPGRCRGMMTIVSDDDEHLQDFAEYMKLYIIE